MAVLWTTVILCGWWGRGEGRRGCVGKYVYHQKTQTVHKLSNKNASGHKIYPHSERLQETVKQQHDILLLLSISRTIHQKDKCWYSLKKKNPQTLIHHMNMVSFICYNTIKETIGNYKMGSENCLQCEKTGYVYIVYASLHRKII